MPIWLVIFAARQHPTVVMSPGDYDDVSTSNLSYA